MPRINFATIEEKEAHLEKTRAVDRAYYHKNKEIVNAKKKQKTKTITTKLEIAERIRETVFELPTTKAKITWHGRGIWNRNYDFCEDCGTTVYKYKANGLCKKCYRRQYYQNHHEIEKKRVKARKVSAEQKRAFREARLKKIKEAEALIAKVKERKDISPRLYNLISNLDLVNERI